MKIIYSSPKQRRLSNPALVRQLMQSETLIEVFGGLAAISVFFGLLAALYIITSY